MERPVESPRCSKNRKEVKPRVRRSKRPSTRTPKNNALYTTGQEAWIRIAVYGEQDAVVEINDCPTDPTHLTHRYYKKYYGEAFGGKRISSIIPAADPPGPYGLPDEMRRRVDRLNMRGARIDPIDLKDHKTDKRLDGFWALQFIGRITPRVLKFVDSPNACPHCGKTRIFCESCGGDWNATCKVCGKQMLIVDYLHEGEGDKRIPYEQRSWRILEGKTWDGSDLVSCHGLAFASKRFIDWLLRIHAAPFYAEPVYFCVDGMNDQQKKWFDDLQKPFEV